MRYIIGPLVLLVCASCAPQEKISDPIPVMLDQSQSHRVRWAAVRQAEKEMFAHPRRVHALQKLVWERGYPVDYSNYAVDQLVAIDETAAKEFLDDAIVLVKDWRTLQHIIDTAVDRNWTDFVPALVRSYAMKSQAYRDEDRPERIAIRKLMPGISMEQVIVDVFTSGDRLDVNRRVAAWALLHRLLEDDGRLVEVLQRIESEDPLLEDLRAGALELGIVPDSLETVTWLRYLRANHRQFWHRAATVISELDGSQKQGIALRHLPTLVYLQDRNAQVLSMSRAELLSQLTAWDASQEHYLKGPTYDGPMDRHPQRLRQWEDQLVWADLATAMAVTQWMRSDRVVRAWFIHADQDQVDSTTEYGGLLRRDENGDPYVHAYSPLIRSHDLKYVPPKELILDGYTALAHYHFHAQEYANRRYAGPGLGDMRRIAKRQRFNALVLTFIDRETMNVDLYFAPDVVIDLGVIHRR